MNCTFFGHGDSPLYLIGKLEKVLEELIVNENADRFYVGNHGNFDFYAYNVLKKLQKDYSHICINVVLAYMPSVKEQNNYYDHSDSILPDSIENVPKRYAISYRNKWMIENSDCVITYVTKSSGGAAQFAHLASKSGKMCINLAEIK